MSKGQSRKLWRHLLGFVLHTYGLLEAASSPDFAFVGGGEGMGEGEGSVQVPMWVLEQIGMTPTLFGPPLFDSPAQVRSAQKSSTRHEAPILYEKRRDETAI